MCLRGVWAEREQAAPAVLGNEWRHLSDIHTFLSSFRARWGLARELKKLMTATMRYGVSGAHAGK